MDFKKFAVAAAILAVLLVVFGAWSARTPQTPVVVEQHVLAGTPTPEGDYAYVEEGPYHTITVHYPGVKTADEKTRLVMEQVLAARIAEFKQNTNVETLTAEEAAFQNLGGERKYALAIEYQKFWAPSFFSYLYTIYEDTGGAHPNTYYTSFVFDGSGNVVGLAQLFPNNPKWLEELSAAVSKEVIAQYKTRAQVTDTTGLLFEEGLAAKVENFSNFVVDGDTLVVFLPPYQVAAYAVGSFEVKIPLKDLQ